MLLSFVSFRGSHTGDRIADEIDRMMENNNLREKVSFMVIDNASNMKKAICVYNMLCTGADTAESDDDNEPNELSVILDDETVWEDLDQDDEQHVQQTIDRYTKRISCFAHTLQLVVKDGLEMLSTTKGSNMKTVTGKCVQMASLCHKSAQFREAFEDKFGSGRAIPTCNQTRWNSMLHQVRAVAELDQSKLEDVLRKTDQNHLILTTREVNMLKELVSILEPFGEATGHVFDEILHLTSCSLCLRRYSHCQLLLLRWNGCSARVG
jgi:hypothetical protein